MDESRSESTTEIGQRLASESHTMSAVWKVRLFVETTALTHRMNTPLTNGLIDGKQTETRSWVLQGHQEA